MSGSSARIEAVPLGWQDLTDIQQRAVDEIAQLLVAAISRRGPVPEVAGMDPQRASQIVFLDGDRGTGKTTVMLSLRAITAREGFDADDLPASVKALRDAKHRLVWLDTLDMEPLARGTNLVGAILVRITKILDRGEATRPNLSRYLDGEGGVTRLTEALTQLQTDAVLVWDRADSHQADPHVRAHDVLRAEKAGTDLQQRLEKVLDLLAAEVPRSIGEDPIFVLPVDDFDLAPTRCLELLRLIRMVHARRLVFVVAGNIRIAETVIRLKNLGELQQLAHGADAVEANEQAAEIAFNNLRKLVPPGQRVRLAPLRLGEALLLDRFGLEARLEAVSIDANQAPTQRSTLSMSEFVGLDDPGDFAGWQLAAWFSGTPRQIHDRAHLLERHAGRQDDWGESLLVDVFRETVSQVREAPTLPWSEREDIAAAFQVDTRTVVDVARLNVRRDYVVDRESALPRGRVRFLLETSKEYRWGERTLSPTMSDALVFAHDLATSLWGGYVRNGVSTRPDLARATWVQTEWETPSGNSYVGVPWPAPHWWSFRDHERFETRWRLRAGGPHPELAWVATLLEVALDAPFLEGQRGTTPARIKAMFQEILVEQPVRLARRFLRGEIMSCCIRMCAPEIGAQVHPEVVFSKRACHSMARDTGLAEVIRAARAAPLAPALRANEGLLPRMFAMTAPDLVWDSIHGVRNVLGGSLSGPSQRVFEAEWVDLPRGDARATMDLIERFADQIRQTSRGDSYVIRNLDDVIDALSLLLAGDPFHEAFGTVFDPTAVDLQQASRRDRQ